MNNHISPLLLIRADATRQMGSGHVMRCFALACDWRARGGRVLWVTHCDSAALRDRIEASGMERCDLPASHPASGDLLQTLELIGQRRPAWVALDGYHFAPRYQQALRQAGSPVLLLDDMAHQPVYHADIVLNQNAHAAELTYGCAPGTRMLRGARYALLRPEFAAWRGWQRQTRRVARNVLVTLGGSDPDNVTAKVIRALSSWRGQNYAVQVVIGPGNPHQSALCELATESGRDITLLTSPPDMPSLMAWADLAIAAAGTTALELAFMQVPSLALVLAENQARVASAHHAAGTLHSLGRQEEVSPQRLACAIRQIADSAGRRSEMAWHGRRIVDGKGLQRVGNILWNAQAEEQSGRAGQSNGLNIRQNLNGSANHLADSSRTQQTRTPRGEAQACCA